MSTVRTLPQNDGAVNATARFDPGWKWCAHFGCKKCPKWWTGKVSSERQLCWESETGEEALEAAFCEETDSPEGGGRCA